MKYCLSQAEAPNKFLPCPSAMKSALEIVDRPVRVGLEPYRLGTLADILSSDDHAPECVEAALVEINRVRCRSALSRSEIESLVNDAFSGRPL